MTAVCLVASAIVIFLYFPFFFFGLGILNYDCIQV